MKYLFANTRLASLSKNQLIAIVVFLILLFFGLDVQLPLGVAGGVPYIIAVLFSYWFSERKYIIYIAIICSLLVLMGFYFSPHGGELWKVVFNRFIAIFSILTTAALVIGMKKYSEDTAVMQRELEITNNELKLQNEKIEKYAAELTISNEEIEMANNAKSVFLSSMSHELRTPMNSVLGYAQLLKMNEDDDLKKKSIDEIISGGRHLLELINKILDLEKIESGKIDISIENYNLSELIAYCLSMVQHSATKSSVQIVDNVSALSDINICVDGVRFKQIMLNLLSNAIKYNIENGEVIIDCSPKEGNMLYLSVTDTGDGLSPEQQIHLFKKFERIGADRSHIEGTGLGLVISKELIELMGGSIGVESEVGKGSRFWITIPLS